jgi:hypothetical protein
LDDLIVGAIGSDPGPVLSTTIREAFLLISETLPNASICLGLSSVTVAVDMVKPDQPTFTFEDTGLLNNDGITVA